MKLIVFFTLLAISAASPLSKTQIREEQAITQIRQEPTKTQIREEPVDTQTRVQVVEEEANEVSPNIMALPSPNIPLVTILEPVSFASNPPFAEHRIITSDDSVPLL